MNAKEIEKAIHDKRGNVSAVARHFGVTRKTLYKRINKSPKLQEALVEARNTMLDNAETTLYDEAINGNITALIFFLKTQGKSRGYTERTEVQHDGGLKITMDWGDNANDND